MSVAAAASAHPGRVDKTSEFIGIVLILSSIGLKQVAPMEFPRLVAALELSPSNWPLSHLLFRPNFTNDSCRVSKIQAAPWTGQGDDAAGEDRTVSIFAQSNVYVNYNATSTRSGAVVWSSLADIFRTAVDYDILVYHDSWRRGIPPDKVSWRMGKVLPENATMGIISIILKCWWFEEGYLCWSTLQNT